MQHNKLHRFCSFEDASFQWFADEDTVANQFGVADMPGGSLPEVLPVLGMCGRSFTGVFRALFVLLRLTIRCVGKSGAVLIFRARVESGCYFIAQRITGIFSLGNQKRVCLLEVLRRISQLRLKHPEIGRDGLLDLKCMSNSVQHECGTTVKVELRGNIFELD